MATTNPLAAAFKKADTREKYRLFGLSAGEPGSRKTSFWLEAPGPIAVFSLDQGLEGVVSRQLRETPDKEIWVKEYEWAPRKDVDLQEKAIETRDQFEADVKLALLHARTLIFDKEGDFWSLFRYAEFGPEQNDAPRNYPALNQRYREFVNAAKSTDHNVGFIDGMKDEWGTKVNERTGARGAASTGKRIRSGFGDLPGLVHIELYHSGLGPVGENPDPSRDWNIHIGKARGPEGWKYAGMDIGNMTFSEVGMLIFPDSEEGDWL
jgi:hypothetical protein